MKPLRVRYNAFSIKIAAAVLLAFICAFPAARAVTRQSDDKKDDKKKEKKKTEPFKVQKLTQGMGLYAIGQLASDRRSLLLVAKKPDSAPNLYVMNVTDNSIRPPLTSFPWGVASPCWSPDNLSVAFAGFDDTGSFSEIYTLELKTGKMHRMTKNSFTDKDPVFTPDGKRILFTTDESPLPDAAFGILHVASVTATGGKPEGFTEDEGSSILPGLTADGKNVLLVKVDEDSGRHSLWRYSMDGKPQRDLTGRKFARIHRYVCAPSGAFIVLWAQEEPEQQDEIYLLDLRSGEARALPDIDSPKRFPALSPNGGLIAFTSLTETGSHLFVFNIAGGQVQQLTLKGDNNHSPVFINDELILFGSDRENESELFTVNLAAPVEEGKKKK
jgi:TolB protein